MKGLREQRVKERTPKARVDPVLQSHPQKVFEPSSTESEAIFYE
jgi:hypothetical protein